MAPGTVFHHDGTSYHVKTGDGYLRILEVETADATPLFWGVIWEANNESPGNFRPPR